MYFPLPVKPLCSAPLKHVLLVGVQTSWEGVGGYWGPGAAGRPTQVMGAGVGRRLVGEHHQLAPRGVLGQGQYRLEGARDGGREAGGQVLVQGGVADT